METEFLIQQVAEITGLSIDTLRYYERIGLLEPVSRAASGHCRYKQKDIDWIGLVINLCETGMPLAQIHHFAALRRQSSSDKVLLQSVRRVLFCASLLAIERTWYRYRRDCRVLYT